MPVIPFLVFDSTVPIQQAPGLIVVTTDAAVSHNKLRRGYNAVGIGYLANNGRFGVHGHRQHPKVVGPSGVAVAELKAIYKAIRELPEYATVLIRSDSQDALRYIEYWQQGDMKFPRGYTVVRDHHEAISLVALAELIRAKPQQYS
jgi:ribonuclease HI